MWKVFEGGDHVLEYLENTLDINIIDVMINNKNILDSRRTTRSSKSRGGVLWGLKLNLGFKIIAV